MLDAIKDFFKRYAKKMAEENSKVIANGKLSCRDTNEPKNAVKKFNNSVK